MDGLGYFDDSGRLVPSVRPEADLFARQMEAVWTVQQLLEHHLALFMLGLQGATIDPALLARTRHSAASQRDHTLRYMRMPQDAGIAAPYKRLGNAIDRGMLGACETTFAVLDFLQLPHVLAMRSRAQAESEHRRRERIERRRREREQAALAAARAPAPTRPKREREERPVCTKCGRRPPVNGSLCGPCAAWEARR